MCIRQVYVSVMIHRNFSNFGYFLFYRAEKKIWRDRQKWRDGHKWRDRLKPITLEFLNKKR